MEAEKGVNPPLTLSEMMKKLSLMKNISVETRMIAEHIILNHGVDGSQARGEGLRGLDLVH